MLFGVEDFKLYPSKFISASKIDLDNSIRQDRTQKRDTGSWNFRILQILTSHSYHNYKFWVFYI